MSTVIKVKKGLAAVLLTRYEIVALRRFCASSCRREFRDIREHAAFHRATEKLYRASALWDDEGATGP